MVKGEDRGLLRKPFRSGAPAPAGKRSSARRRVVPPAAGDQCATSGVLTKNSADHWALLVNIFGQSQGWVPHSAPPTLRVLPHKVRLIGCRRGNVSPDFSQAEAAYSKSACAAMRQLADGAMLRRGARVSPGEPNAPCSGLTLSDPELVEGESKPSVRQSAGWRRSRRVGRISHSSGEKCGLVA